MITSFSRLFTIALTIAYESSLKSKLKNEKPKNRKVINPVLKWFVLQFGNFISKTEAKMINRREMKNENSTFQLKNRKWPFLNRHFSLFWAEKKIRAFSRLNVGFCASLYDKEIYLGLNDPHTSKKSFDCSLWIYVI